jgi:hypothetical protein
MPIVALMMVELGKYRLGKQYSGPIANWDYVIQHRGGGTDLLPSEGKVKVRIKSTATAKGENTMQFSARISLSGWNNSRN